MEIISKKISDLIHPGYNPRKISKSDFEQLKKSLLLFDAVEPAIINTYNGRKNIIVGGNQRIAAAESIGWKSFPCVEVSLCLEKEKELNIRLNKNTGEWDINILENEFSTDDLIEFGFDEYSAPIEVIDEPEKVEIVPFKKYHILLSMPYQKSIEIQDIISLIEEKGFIEVEYGSN